MTRPYYLRLVLLATNCLAGESAVVPLQKFGVEALNKRVEAVHGDRTRPGQPFVIRIHAEAGFIVMPHTHPVDENIVILKGSWALGMGPQYRKERLEAMEVGDFGFARHDMAHFALSKTDTIIQVHGIGPFRVRWVVPMYELSDKGVMLIETAEEPGRVTTTFPQDCFELTLGARVRGSDGEGTVIGAQCTPAELTQYRVQKADGKRFWAQKSGLEVLKTNQ
ncbi:MAG: cupin domain-containing protein [Proteobacteria bacterium]|nr:cupin domain-containing protein [Pseudomonadota bacterium]